MAISISKIIEGHTICALGDAAAWPVQGLIKHFRRARRLGARDGSSAAFGCPWTVNQSDPHLAADSWASAAHT